MFLEKGLVANEKTETSVAGSCCFSRAEQDNCGIPGGYFFLAAVMRIWKTTPAVQITMPVIRNDSHHANHR